MLTDDVGRSAARLYDCPWKPSAGGALEILSGPIRWEDD